MKHWNDPRVAITFLLILLFAYAYIQDTSDEAMKGALIAAFAAAYGYWIGAAKANEQATENTGKAFEAITAAANAAPPQAGPTGFPDDPVHTVEERRS